MILVRLFAGGDPRFTVPPEGTSETWFVRFIQGNFIQFKGKTGEPTWFEVHDDTRSHDQIVIRSAEGEDEVGELSEQDEKNKGDSDFLFHMALLVSDGSFV